MKRFTKVIALLLVFLIPITSKAEPKFLPCNISDDQLKFEISRVFSLAISEIQKGKGPTLESEEIIKFSKDFTKELERNDKCQNENPGDLCGLDSDIILCAQDWDPEWKVLPVKISKDNYIIAKVAIEATQEINRRVITLSLLCEDNRIVLSDVNCGDGPSVLSNLRYNLNELHIAK